MTSKTRYFAIPLISGSQYETYDYPAPYHGIAQIDFLDGVDVVEHTFVRGDRLDKLAFQFFGDDQYWWLIALVNGIEYGFGITPGTVLKIPSDIGVVLRRLDMV